MKKVFSTFFFRVAVAIFLWTVVEVLFKDYSLAMPLGLLAVASILIALYLSDVCLTGLVGERGPSGPPGPCGMTGRAGSDCECIRRQEFEASAEG